MQLYVDLFIAYMSALWVLIIGILRLIRSSRLHQIHKEFDTQIIAKNWWIVMISGILLVLLGVLSLMNPAVTMAAVGTMIGANIMWIASRWNVSSALQSASSDSVLSALSLKIQPSHQLWWLLLL